MLFPFDVLALTNRMTVSGDAPASVIVVVLYRWLLFRLMFSSGAVKLLSGDPTWRDLTALEYHYWTQPLPSPLSWLVHQAHPGIHKLSCAIMFASWFGGVGPGLLATALSIFAFAYYFLPPMYSVTVAFKDLPTGR